MPDSLAFSFLFVSCCYAVAALMRCICSSGPHGKGTRDLGCCEPQTALVVGSSLTPRSSSLFASVCLETLLQGTRRQQERREDSSAVDTRGSIGLEGGVSSFQPASQPASHFCADTLLRPYPGDHIHGIGANQRERRRRNRPVWSPRIDNSCGTANPFALLPSFQKGERLRWNTVSDRFDGRLDCSLSAELASFVEGPLQEP